MTQEEKAKAYDEAITTAKQILSNNCSVVEKLCIECVFPALKEGEDESIRKEIISIVKSYRDRCITEGNHRFDDCIAWLEKHGEQKTADKKYTFNAIPRLLDMIQPTDRAKAYCQKLIDSLIQEGYGADAKIVGEYLKQMNGEKVAMATMDEQKPSENKGMNLVEEEMTPFQKKVFFIIDTAIEEEQGLKQVCDELLSLAHDEIMQKPAWSDEDETGFCNTLWAINQAHAIAKNESDMGACWSAENWLKSLKGRVQPKQKWSDEDEQMINDDAEKQKGLNGDFHDGVVFTVDEIKEIIDHPQQEHPEVDVEKEEYVGVAESPLKTFQRVNEFESGASYRH